MPTFVNLMSNLSIERVWHNSENQCHPSHQTNRSPTYQRTLSFNCTSWTTTKWYPHHWTSIKRWKLHWTADLWWSCDKMVEWERAWDWKLQLVEGNWCHDSFCPISAFLDHLHSHLVHAKPNAEPDGIKRIISKLTSRFKPYESQGWIGVDWDSITYKWHIHTGS